MNQKERLLSKDEKRIPIDPVMAATIGLNETIFLTQLQYWISIKEENNDNSTFADGKMWVYNTYEQWHEQLPFMSVRTIRRTIENLEKNGLIISENHNGKGYDKTKWYTIDYEILSLLDDKANKSAVQNGQIDVAKMDSACGQNGQTNTIEYIIDKHSKKTFKCLNGASSVNDDALGSQNPSGFTPKGVDAEGDAVRHVDGFNLSRDRRSIRSSEGSATNYKSLLASIRKSFERCCIPEYAREDIQKDIVYFYYMYYNALHEYHPNISASAMDAVVKALYDGTKVVCDYSHEIYAPMIDDYFDANMECDYHITHFISGNIRDMRWYETESEDYVPDRYFERLYSDMRP